MKSYGRWWDIYSYKGHQITGPHLWGDEDQAMDHGRAFISSWNGSTLILIEKLDDINK